MTPLVAFLPLTRPISSAFRMDEVPAMRSGLLDEAGTSDESSLITVAALLRTFSKEACDVAARYTRAKGRKLITGRDMRYALMYCARTFFSMEQSDLETRVQEEVLAMQEESTDDEEVSTDEEGEDEGGEEEEEVEATSPAPPNDEEGGHYTGTVDEADRKHAARVDKVVEVWHLWNPDDPVHKLLKRAIDKTG